MVAALQKPVIRLNTRFPVDQIRREKQWGISKLLEIFMAHLHLPFCVIHVIQAIYTSTKWVFYFIANVLTPKYEIVQSRAVAMRYIQ